MAAMIPGLKSDKMSSSAPADTKIMFSDSADVVRDKIMDAQWFLGASETNAIMAMFEHIVFPAKALIKEAPGIKIQLSAAAPSLYDQYDKLKEDFENGLLHPSHLKESLAVELNRIIDSVRQSYADSSEWREAERAGYGTADI